MRNGSWVRDVTALEKAAIRFLSGLGYRVVGGREFDRRVEALIRMGMGKESDSAVARKAGVSRERVRQIRTKAGLPRPPRARSNG